MNMLRLSVEENGKELTQVDLGPDKILAIGRGEDNDLVLKSKNVSKFHCKIIGDGQSWVLQDLDSTNGVKINGRIIQEEKLDSGDIIELYPFKLNVTLLLPAGDDEGEDNTVIDAVAEQAWEDKTIMSTVAITDGVAGTGIYARESESEPDNNFVVVKNGPAAGLSLPIHGRITVGRGEGCDLILDDSFISREHLLITLKDGVCRFENLSAGNSVMLNGKQCHEGVLKDGNILKLGNSELKLRLEGGGRLNFLNNLSVRTRLLLLSGLLVFMVGFFFVVFSGDDEQEKSTESTPRQNEAVESAGKSMVESSLPAGVSLEQKRQRSLFLYQARQFAQDGALEKAANRLEASLEVVPDDLEAQELLTEIRARISRKEQKKSERTILLDSVRQQIEKDLLLVEAGRQQQEYANSLALLEKIRVQQEKYPELKELFNDINDKIEEVKTAQIAFNKLQDSNKKIYEQKVASIQEIYKKGWQAYKTKQYSEAKKYWEQVSTSKYNVPERKQALFYLSKLNSFLAEKTQSEYYKGLARYKKKDYSGALWHWNQVLQIYPNHPDIKPKVEQILPAQLEKAKHLYQEGLVYEGINNIERAIKNWQQVLKELPLENSKYNRKAKAKLAAYGKK